MFIPLISKNTQERAAQRPVFLREWHAAEKEDEIVLNAKFIFPLIIDEETTTLKVDQLQVPSRFKDKHFGRAIDGHLSDEMRNILITEIRDKHRERTPIA